MVVVFWATWVRGMAAVQTILERLEDLYQGRHLSSYRAGQGIPLPKDTVLLVCRGIVQVGTIHSNGDEALLGMVGPGVPLGLSLTWLDPYYAKALTDVDILTLPLEEVERDADLGGRLLPAVIRRLRQAEALLSLTGKRRVAERLQQFLLLMAQEYGQPTGTGTRLLVRLTHQDMASAIGTTRVTVTRLLNQWRQEGHLDLDEQRHLVVKFS